jgi:SAM-dependent methyltransferase/4-hydroxybenzoate polyprenyltransferase
VRSNAAVAELVAYGRERIATTHFALLVAIVAGLGFAVARPQGAADALLRVALAFLLVVQFRLWDDVADREHDRLRHPERVLQRHKGRATPFLVAMGVLTVPILALLLLLDHDEARVGAYGLLALALAVVYGSHATTHGRVMRMGWVLLQFPVFVLLLLPWPVQAQGWVAAAIAYLVVMFHDWATSADAADLRQRTGVAPWPEMFEQVTCPACASVESTPFVNAEDDLTGKPGRFSYVRCRNCRLAYLNPRLKLEHVAPYYEGESKASEGAGWGWLEPLHARLKGRIAQARASIIEGQVAQFRESAVLDIEAHGPPLQERNFGVERFDVITMWDFLQLHYDPAAALRIARDLLAPGGVLVIETPRLDSRTWRLFHERWPGLKAPRHTVLFTRHSLESMVDAAGLEVLHFLPQGSTPSYFYLFAGAAFKMLKGGRGEARGIVVPFVLGHVLLWPFLLFEGRLALATQVVICRRRHSP